MKDSRSLESGGDGGDTVGRVDRDKDCLESVDEGGKVGRRSSSRKREVQSEGLSSSGDESLDCDNGEGSGSGTVEQNEMSTKGK